MKRVMYYSKDAGRKIARIDYDMNEHSPLFRRLLSKYKIKVIYFVIFLVCTIFS